jgi:hypothetical protein
MNEKNEKTVEIQVANDQVVVVERAPRLLGGVSVKTRIHAGKKTATFSQ